MIALKALDAVMYPNQNCMSRESRGGRTADVTIHRRELYTSANGDRWSLARDAETGRVFVRHQANLASGGNVSDTELSAFLGQSGLGPEKQELLRLIGTLVEDDGEPRAGASVS